MIAWLTGFPQVINNYLMIKTKGGVGYKVMVNDSVLNKIKENEELSLFIFSYIKEDRFELYGFVNESDLRLFELLVSVTGCGPKTALGISEAGSKAIIEAVQQAQVSFFTQCPRVGKKLAQKLIIELKNKLGGLKDLDLTPKSPTYNDAKEALLGLGFQENELDRILSQIEVDELKTAEVIKLALKQLKK